MDAGEIDVLLQRIERAIGRIDGAMKRRPEPGDLFGAPVAAPAVDAALVAENARLRDAVSGAIARIDALIADAAGEGA